MEDSGSTFSLVIFFGVLLFLAVQCGTDAMLKRDAKQFPVSKVVEVSSKYHTPSTEHEVERYYINTNKGTFELETVHLYESVLEDYEYKLYLAKNFWGDSYVWRMVRQKSTKVQQAPVNIYNQAHDSSTINVDIHIDR